MTRRTLQRGSIAAGIVLLAAPRVAAALPPGAVLPLSILWYAAAGWLAWAGYSVLRARWSRRAAALTVSVVAALPVLVTAVPAPARLAVRLPCPRNWAWLPSWLLRSSPTRSLVFDLEGAPVKLCYGSPAARGRRMLGGSRVPYGRLWRTGANEPTLLIAPAGLTLAGIRVPPGRASLYTVPGPETWEIVPNLATSQWGIESEYSDGVRAQELGRAILGSAQAAEPAERLTFRVVTTEDGHDLELAWENTRVRMPVRPPGG